RGAPHVARRDVAPPAVVEAGEDEDRELDHDHERDRPDEERVVVDRHAAVEPQGEGQVPGRGDESRVGDQVPDPVPVDRDHWAAGTGPAARTASTTRSWVAESMPAQSGTEKFSRASCSVTGRSPS